MKVYEIGLPDHYDDDSNDGCDCTLWIASNHPIELREGALDDGFYLREIEFKTPHFKADPTKIPGIDLIIR